MMEVIVAKESEEAATEIVLINLNTLILINLPHITTFLLKPEEVGELRPQSSEDNANRTEEVGELRPQNSVKKSVNPFFSQHVSLPNLENLIIRKAESLRVICDKNFITHTFAKLKRVEIVKCDKLEWVFPFGMLETLTCLKELCISCCAILKGIFDTDGNPNFTELFFNQTLPQLSSLTLIDLPNLEYVWSISAEELFIFEKIELLSIVKCPKLKRLYNGSFLRQLEIVKMKCDESDDEIVRANEKEIVDEIVEVNEMVEEERRKITDEMVEIKQFDSKVSFLNLEILKFEGLNKVRILCTKLLIEDSFAKLESVEIDSCDKLEKVFPSNMLHVLKNLRILKIKNCSLLEGIFEVEESQVAKRYVCLPQLSRLELINLPNLKYVWSEHPCELQSFENMKEINIFQCPEFKNKHPGELTDILEEKPVKTEQQCESSKAADPETGDV